MTQASYTLPDELLTLARRVLDENRAAGLRIAVAESCTGGLVSAALTEIPGSSDVFEAGFVTYSNEAKHQVLGVGEEVIETFGSVSVACAWAMANGAIEKTNADVAVSITGIAGPGGGSEQKPVGTVVFSRAVRGQEFDEAMADMKNFGDLGRAGVRLQAALCALELLLPSSSPSP
ncbi:CinA family protein [Sphingosinicella ginsenosidimutans]|uniref:CinA family protein n=1 Tax=Allosphingosinicella ginsenosidimutans TaxID=1176539 RepID=A0A5C6TWW7_9SPHN|nr:CinA family protein [Sphingosinicella ginsenosidimutans]TXC64630.1 CinA family protein [Sphingosinicella ginsenosidimutans]